MNRYLHAAFACAAVPLVGSVLIYLLWRTTGTPWGQLLMWGLLMVSVVALPIGFMALMIYAGLPDEEGERTRGQLIRQLLVVSILLLLGPITCFVLARRIRATEEAPEPVEARVEGNALRADLHDHVRLGEARFPQAFEGRSETDQRTSDALRVRLPGSRPQIQITRGSGSPVRSKRVGANDEVLSAFLGQREQHVDEVAVHRPPPLCSRPSRTPMPAM